ncbi:MAG: SRPBCC domain-containing protein [Saprospiraceae bacterium]
MEFKVEIKLNATPEKIYEAWLSSKGHSSMTGSSASIKDQPGTRFTAWDGYIEGEILDLEKDKRIVQTWRTSEFKKNQEDSLVDIELTAIDEHSTKLQLRHCNLLDSDMQYKQGWKDHYFAPMKAYFGS